ncbi:MAG: 1-aminocyclopropane-1-carboxylate deaminase/D-cysteine desulfhydrase [Bacteroidetes bacterium]|nr:1-aminocyclopropane-1-carboxylate deaminase/D-cysteine desulfhydrase [Bacteroidota bacterium]
MIISVPTIQPLRTLFAGGPAVDVLKLQEVHPVVSGNKWYKLQYYLQEAAERGYTKIITRGGPYSNHIIATAWAARELGLESIGIIRGLAAPMLSPTLQDAQAYGMTLHFTEKNQFANFQLPESETASALYIPEGGVGRLGIQGAAEILSGIDFASYTHILGASGTGTMITGLALQALPHQQVLGISVLNNAPSPFTEISEWLKNWPTVTPPTLLYYAYGGYAKVHPTVLSTIRDCWEQEQLPLDFVYTGKLFSATRVLIQQGYFAKNNRLLLIHSGGLQGNRSLPVGSLPF